MIFRDHNLFISLSSYRTNEQCVASAGESRGEPGGSLLGIPATRSERTRRRELVDGTMATEAVQITE